MSELKPGRLQPQAPTFAELFTPKLVTVLREGYGAAELRSDAIAGLTVAIVALPLSMAIAIASGLPPAHGLISAIISGFLISALGGSRYQIGGPAGAFIVLVSATVDRHGVDGMLLATIMAGFMLVAMGFLRLGTYVKLVPYPVTVGFTTGIAIIIMASQLKELFGLTLPGKEPGPLLDKLGVLGQALPTANPAAIAVSLAAILIIVGLKKVRPHWPGMLIAVVAGALATVAFGLDVETINSRFGGMSGGIGSLSLPTLSLEKMQAVLPDAIAFALLGAIESLLSAVVADGMTGRQHRSNSELVAQGVANVAGGLFGGMVATGTIARTATNVRAGAHGPVSGMLHSVFLAAFVLLAGSLAGYIPLAALAGVLAVVAWNMAEKRELWTLVTSSRGDALVVLTTLFLTVFRDLTEAIIVGFALGAVVFVNRMAAQTGVECEGGIVSEDRADGERRTLKPFDVSLASNPEIAAYRISGAFFFGAAAAIGATLDRIADTHKAFIVDFSGVPLLDSTAANTMHATLRKAERRGVKVYLTGTSTAVRRVLFLHGVRPPHATYLTTLDDAVDDWNASAAASGGAAHV
ncbi:MAG: SulP family inorganic anion transporter [Hyphomicrobiaceae bacterium]